MKNVVVTGGAGFIGSEIVRQLQKKKYNVRIVDNLSKKNKISTKNIDFVKADLTKKSNSEKALKNCDMCIHLAAKIGGIGYFHKYPATILSENNKMYSSVFEAAVFNKVKRFIYISSSMVYESAVKFPSKESDVEKIPPPVSTYGFSKLIGEEYCKAFFSQHKLSYSICRPFNAYGKNEYPGEEIGYAHVIPDIVSKVKKNQYPLELLGNGKQIRCFTHVSDLAEGIIAIAKSKKTVNKTYNVADPNPIDMESLAKKIWKIMNIEKKFKVKYVKGFEHDVQKRIPNTQKIEQDTGWKPKIDFDKGLRETVKWLTHQK